MHTYIYNEIYLYLYVYIYIYIIYIYIFLFLYNKYKIKIAKVKVAKFLVTVVDTLVKLATDLITDTTDRHQYLHYTS